RGGGVTGIADVDAVDKYLRMIGIGAADEKRRLPAGTSYLHGVQAGDVLEHVDQRALLLGRDIIGGDYGFAGPELIFRGRDARGADDDLLELVIVSRHRGSRGEHGRDSEDRTTRTHGVSPVVRPGVDRRSRVTGGPGTTAAP